MFHVRRCAAIAVLLMPMSAVAAEKTAAVVNGEPISVIELDAAVAQIPAATTPLSAAQKRARRLETLSVLIDDRMVRQFLKQKGSKVDPQELQKQLAALEASQKSQGSTLEAYLKEAGLTVEQVKENFGLMLQLRNYLESQTTDERLRRYFEAHQDFFDRTTVKTSHIVLRTSGATPAEREAAMAKLRAIRGDLAARKIDFATAAKAHSQCPSGALGGDVGYIVRKFQVDEAYARTAFAMQVGGVSDVVETEAGYHLIWVTDRKPGKPARFESVVDDVRECYEAELKQNLLQELRKKAKIEITLKD